MRHVMASIAPVLVVMLGWSSQADARPLSRSGGGVDAIPAGFKDVGFDNTLLVRYTSLGATKTLNADYLPSLHFRYFVIRDLGVSLHVGGFIGMAKTETNNVETKQSDLGVVGTLMANYYLSIGGKGFFWKPGLGGGGFYGGREVPTAGAAGQVTKSTISGGLARLDLGFAFFVGSNWNLNAGIDVIARFGSEKPDAGGTSESFTTIDAAISAGFGYTW